MTLNSGLSVAPFGLLSGPGNLTVIDSAGGGTVVLGGTYEYRHSPHVANTYTGGTTVLSGTLEVVNSHALPNTGVLTVAGPAAIVSSARAGTLFGSNAMGQASSLETQAWTSQAASPGTDAAGSPVAPWQLAWA